MPVSSQAAQANHPSAFQRFVLPGLAFKAVVIGGGYATGREIAEFFLPAGPWGGIAAMAVANTSAVAGNVSEHLGMPRGIRVGAVEVLRHLMPPLRRTRQRGPRGKPFGPRGAADGHLQVLSPLGQ